MSEPSSEMLERFSALSGMSMQLILRRDIEISHSIIGKYISAIWYKDSDPYGFEPENTYQEGYYFLCPDLSFKAWGMDEAESVTEAVMIFDDREGAFKAAQLAITNMTLKLKQSPDRIVVLSLVVVDEGVCAKPMFLYAKNSVPK